MRHAWVFLTVLATGAGTLAQDRPGAGEILIDSTGPDSYHERRTVPLPPAGPERDAFLKEFLRVDPRDNRVTDRSGTVSATDFYARLQRADLVAQARTGAASGSGSWPEGAQWRSPRPSSGWW
jgi:hypothetical protein